MNKHVREDDLTTLRINGAWQPVGYMTARAVISHFASGRIKAVDAFGTVHDWDSWFSQESVHYLDSPYIKTASREWTVPTVVIITHFFGYRHVKGRKEISLKQIYKLYKGVCQYTKKWIPFSEASRDHVYPLSKGGANDISNIVLCSKDWNSRKSDKIDHGSLTDINGDLVKPIVFTQFHHNTAISNEIRQEWRQFLYLE